MGLIQYPLTHPYPKKPLFEILTIVLILLALPALVLINIVVSGYELVPVLRPNMGPNDTVPEWWNKAHVPRLLRREPPSCEPKDFGRGDVIRLTPSLFEYKVLSAWQNSTARDAHDETRITYEGASFKDCYVYESRFDFSLIDYTQTVTSAIYCPDTPANMYMEASVTFADEISKDFVGQYYGFHTNVFDFVQESSRNYRRVVFAVLDVISTDSLMIMGDQRLSSPILSLSTVLNVTTREFESTSITYANGTLGGHDGSMGLAWIYNDTVYNLAAAVTNAVYLDLGNIGPNNIFINLSAVNDTFLPNLAPRGIDPNLWVRNDSMSFYYGRVVAPYQTWAQMLRAGLPQNITLGNLADLPEDSQMVTSYLCPSYRLKRMFPFLGSVFIGTASMYMSAWAGWLIISAACAQWLSGPCPECTFGGGKPCGLHHSPQESGVIESGLGSGDVVYRPPVTNRDSGQSYTKGSQ